MNAVFKKFIALLCLLTTTLAYRPVSPVIFIIHGTFANKAKWHCEGGKFFEPLKASLAQLNPQEKIVTFKWSGRNRAHDRIVAGYRLAHQLSEVPADEKITIIAHSHGGNVVALATKFLVPSEKIATMSQAPIDENVAEENLESPTFDTYWRQQARTVVQMLTNEEETNNPGQLLNKLTKMLNQTTKAYHTSQSNIVREALNILKPIPFDRTIQTIFTLGTPVHVGDYNFNMDMVDAYYALFSEGDIVQPVAGLYQRYHNQHDKIFNIRVMTRTKRVQGLFHPTHSGLHASFIGTHILNLPNAISLFAADQTEKPLIYDVVFNIEPENGGPEIFFHKNITFDASLRLPLPEIPHEPVAIDS